MGTILLTGLDEVTLGYIKDGAARQELTAAEYVTRLLELHLALRRASEAGTDSAEMAAAILQSGGLE